MTIKKRLFISNILMIIIPVIVSLVTVFVSMLVLNAIFNNVLFELIRKEREARAAKGVTPNAWMAFFSFLALIMTIAIMYFTNRFLIRFVFRKIEQPLEMLSNGVHQISDGNLNHRINYCEDDEFKPICEDFNNMASRLKTSIEEVQKNEQNRNELFASISHDLRSPLTSIKAFVEGLLDGVASTPESQREYLQIISQKTDDINNMVSQLFLYSKMEMGNYPIYPERLDIMKEISGFITASHEEYKAKGLTVESGDMVTGKYIFADPLQLRSMFTNILDNSSKYKNKTSASAAIRCIANDDNIRIIFEDDGPGVPEEIVSKLFDVFYRSDPSRNNPQQGSGLGLAIAAKAVERMNGRIFAENRNEGGLRLIIEIPEMKGGKPE